MADPLQDVSPGQPLEIQAASVNAWNAMARRRADDGGAQRINDPITPSLEVIIRNDTGSNMPARSVLRITNWVVTPVTFPFEVAARPTFSADTPDNATNLIVILRDAIPAGQLGRAILSGHAVVDVKVNSSVHVYARPIAGDNTKLESATSGSIRVINWETSGATRRASVCIQDLLGATTREMVSCVMPIYASGGGMTGIKVEKVPVTGIFGKAVCYTNPTDCCPCTDADAPPTMPFNLTSSCSDLNGTNLTLTYNAGTNEWFGSAVTAGGRSVAVHVTWDSTNGWLAKVYYAGVLVNVLKGTPSQCAPLIIAWATGYDPCFSCNGGATGGYTLSSTTTNTPNVTVCCPGSSVANVLCLKTSIVSGACADLAGWKDRLTNSGSQWTTPTTHAYCVSPFHAACNVLPVSPKIVCDGATFKLYFAYAGYLDFFVADLPTLCGGGTVTVDVPFDSSGATFPPGVDTTCCVATVRFTITNNPLDCNPCCSGVVVPATVCLTDGTGHKGDLTGGGPWSGTINSVAYVLSCNAATGNYQLTANGGAPSVAITTVCSPFALTFAGSVSVATGSCTKIATGCCGSSIPQTLYFTGSDGSSGSIEWNGTDWEVTIGAVMYQLVCVFAGGVYTWLWNIFESGVLKCKDSPPDSFNCATAHFQFTSAGGCPAPYGGVVYTITP